jgi:Big-like domain-containing protein
MSKHLIPSVLTMLAIACGYSPEHVDTADASDESESSGEPATTIDPSTTVGTTMSGDDESSGGPDTGVEESSSDDAASESSETTAGATVPTIVETVPLDGTIGVLADAPLVVRFSEAMDQAATQAAYQSADIPAGFVTFGWNGAADELTITPIVPLPYAMGDIDAAPLAYQFTITTAAKSLAGEALAEDVVVGFTTLRRVTQIVERDAALSGNVGDVGGPLGSTFFGDRSSNEPVRWAVTFDATELAPEIAALESAELHAAWNSQSGNPWSGLGGGAVYQHVSFVTLGDAYDAAPIDAALGLFGSANDVDVMRDVAGSLDAVLADMDGYDARLQLRIRWVLDSDNDAAYDSVSLVPEDLELHVTYLAP